MRKVQLENKALGDVQFWLINNRRLLEKTLRLLEECQRDPFNGTGKPEGLKGDYKGQWSRRIDQEHRLIYEVTDDLIIVHSLRGHYDDK